MNEEKARAIAGDLNLDGLSVTQIRDKINYYLLTKYSVRDIREMLQDG